MKKGLWQGPKIAGTSISITHSLFEDGTLLFGRAVVQEAKQLKQILDLYTSVSGQKNNAQKSKVFILNTNVKCGYLKENCQDFRLHIRKTSLHIFGHPFLCGIQ